MIDDSHVKRKLMKVCQDRNQHLTKSEMRRAHIITNNMLPPYAYTPLCPDPKYRRGIKNEP